MVSLVPVRFGRDLKESFSIRKVRLFVYWFTTTDEVHVEGTL